MLIVRHIKHFSNILNRYSTQPKSVKFHTGLRVSVREESVKIKKLFLTIFDKSIFSNVDEILCDDHQNNNSTKPFGFYNVDNS